MNIEYNCLIMFCFCFQKFVILRFILTGEVFNTFDTEIFSVEYDITMRVTCKYTIIMSITKNFLKKIKTIR